ncbi:transcriptional regulator, LysR family [Polynucleobacter asymbioticus QLW-P1DMWA-1]|uniref:Transcriptional regulator, LysR family n=2 Tax=Polynucleobacter asymbioticus TaxID=576611 RepID=A4SZ60_POLAQ|nr:LysR family transcriptional regulator [Polynucleobacter asymbioticus]ABP34774.1 transcriptional regulator, LysR family [Polynucleobacter asymbioticus QLW-P1DMWA-1]
MNSMNWDHLQYFLALAKDGRLIVAARSLGVNHTTVSRRIQALEREMGVQLFSRNNLGFELTEAGMQLQNIAHKVEQQINGISKNIGSENTEISGTVRVGATEGFGTFIVGPILYELSKKFPRLSIDLLSLPRIVNLSRREADIAITLQRPTRGPYLVTKLRDYELKLYASNEYLASNPAILSRGDLDKQTFISYVDDLLFSKELSYLDEICKPKQISFRSTSIQSQLQAARVGLGVAVLPSFMVQAQDGLQEILPKDIRIIRSFWMMMPNEYKKVDRMNLVWDCLKKEASG